MGFYRPEDMLPGAPRPGSDRRVAYENGIMFLTLELEPGYRAQAHNHSWPTFYYITGGTGRVLVGEEWQEVQAGTLAMVPAEAMHSIEATTRLTLIEAQVNCPQEAVNRVLGR